MSVTLSIATPINDEEKSYDLAISSESGFRSVIEPIAEKYELTLVDWGTFSEITKENLTLFLEELKILCNAISMLKNESIQTKEHYLSRLSDLAFEVERLIKKRPEISLLIG